jgi:hypothetical protein
MFSSCYSIRRFFFSGITRTTKKKTVREDASELLSDERSEEFSGEACSRRFCVVACTPAGFLCFFLFTAEKKEGKYEFDTPFFLPDVIMTQKDD